jgi:antitoxin VapB
MTNHTDNTQQSSSSLDLLNTVSGPGQRLAEWNEKWDRIASLLDRENLSAILIRRNESIAWATAGQVEARVLIPAETAVISLLLTRDGHKYYLTTNNEAPRIADEEFPGLGYEPIISNWYEDNALASIRRMVGEGSVGTDMGLPGLHDVNLAALRAPLTAAEVSRFRWLAQRRAETTAVTLFELKPGMTENEMAALIAQRLIAQGILPTVLLMATDDRIRKYKHAVSRGGILERYGMLNLCARKWGLAVSITRFVHFGPPPQELVDGFAACAEINAKLLHASRSGVTSAALYAVAEDAYRKAGYAGEEKLHHQGGPTGYMEREWVATPHGTQTIVDPEALAWNPSIRGAKAEDTVLLNNGATEVLTETPTLPQIDAKVDGINYPAAGLLIR